MHVLYLILLEFGTLSPLAAPQTATVQYFAACTADEAPDCAFVATVYQVPQLLHSLPLSALLATCSGLRQHTHQRVRRISYPVDQPAFEVLAKGSWPQLLHLDLAHGCVEQPHIAVNATDLRPLQLNLSHMRSDFADILMIRGLCGSVTVLSLSSVKPTPEQMLHLVEADLPALEDLNLSHNNLSVRTIYPLANALWPCLKYLNLCHNNLYVGSIRCLTAPSWPQRLNLNGTQFQGAWWDQPCQGTWPNLQGLLLSDNNFLQGCGDSTARPQWPAFRELQLRNNGINEAAFQNFAR